MAKWMENHERSLIGECFVLYILRIWIQVLPLIIVGAEHAPSSSLSLLLKMLDAF